MHVAVPLGFKQAEFSFHLKNHIVNYSMFSQHHLVTNYQDDVIGV